MNWTTIWINLLGAASILGIDMGFWVGMAVVLLIVIWMNVVFWSIKPKRNDGFPDAFKNGLSSK